MATPLAIASPSSVSRTGSERLVRPVSGSIASGSRHASTPVGRKRAHSAIHSPRPASGAGVRNQPSCPAPRTASGSNDGEQYERRDDDERSSGKAIPVGRVARLDVALVEVGMVERGDLARAAAQHAEHDRDGRDEGERGLLVATAADGERVADSLAPSSTSRSA